MTTSSTFLAEDYITLTDTSFFPCIHSNWEKIKTYQSTWTDSSKDFDEWEKILPKISLYKCLYCGIEKIEYD